MVHAPTDPPEFSEGGAIDLQPALEVLLNGGVLNRTQAEQAFEAMMSGSVHHGEMGALLALLAARKPDPEEVAGATSVMRRHVTAVPWSGDPAILLDTAGTGGAPKTFNVSTAAAIIVAACGSPVAKHGNRSRTGRGSAEVLAALGVNVDAPLDRQTRCLEEAGVCFCFAVNHHPATRHVMPVRKALGFPTIFNLLGPLTNPAGAGRQIMGVWDPTLAPIAAETLHRLGTVRSIVLHSDDGLDEASIAAPTRLWIATADGVCESSIEPEALALTPAPLESVRAGSLDEAAAMVKASLAGTAAEGVQDMVRLNAALALMAARDDVDAPDALIMIDDAISSGRPLATLESLIRISTS
ncbi:MAG: anthranilate phosphoribosyltransferase [Phycisphaerales bacterium]|nr:anthranilate phosphoribosyltransferase [Phycisphaerales bacterium]